MPMRPHAILVCLMAGSLAAVFPRVASAQDASGTSATTTATNAICMMGPEPNVSGGEILIVVTAGPDQTVAAQGFQPAPCPTDPGAFANYQSQICQLANSAQPADQESFFETYGVKPSDLCTWAGSVVGLP